MPEVERALSDRYSCDDEKGECDLSGICFLELGGGEGIIMTSAGEIIPTAKSPQNFSTQ